MQKRSLLSPKSLTALTMITTKLVRLVSAAVGSTVLAASAHASLAVSYQFNGFGNWSLDAATEGGSITAFVPTGSIIQKAFLYSTMWTTGITPGVDFNGTTISGGAWTNLGANGYLNAYRADVTAQVAATIGGGSAVPFSFSINSESSGYIDGEALAIVYSNPLEKKRTIAFLDGFSASGGDATAINLASALTAPQLANPNFEAMMSLGIGFGYQPSGQYSLVDVNGARLTTSAGGYDDGYPGNGGLITIGGYGDSILNPANPFQTDGGGTFYDDELYNLTPFLAAGNTTISINTQNPSGDDNIFFAGINITAEAGVNQPPPPVPDATSSLALLGLSLAGLLGLRRRLG